ncbi:MAG: adenine phosphoribosyltransferase [Candidatus Methylacidiphilales bacterium]
MLLKSATDRLKNAVRNIPDFPEPGIIFRDISPILSDGQLFRLAGTIFSDRYQRKPVDAVVAIDARGFIFGSTLAYILGVGLVLVRKKGKLPFHTIEASFSLEYGSSKLQIHSDAIRHGQRVVVVDDVLATGGTLGAACELVRRLGGEVLEAAVLIELEALGGRAKVEPTPVFSIIQF